MNTLLLEKLIGPHYLSNQLNQTEIWADPCSILATVKEELIDLPLVDIRTPYITLGSWNGEYLWQKKANNFLSSYEQIVKRHLLLAFQEVSHAGLSTIGLACNYNYIVSSSNSRGQAVGFLVHPRLNIVAVHEYTEMSRAYGIHDLRPALQIDLFDPQTKTNLTVITVHLKSMLGGLAFTSLVRKKQLEVLINEMEKRNNPIIILGDFNCFLDISADPQVLLENGFNIANPHNRTSTQLSGGRLDGLFHKDLAKNSVISRYKIHNFWRSSLAGRSLSDHGLLTWQLTNIER